MRLDLWIFYSLFGFVLVRHIRLTSKFLRLFRFAVFLHSSCSVVVSYFMLIPVFAILLFSVTVFQPSFWWNKFLWKKPGALNISLNEMHRGILFDRRLGVRLGKA